MIEHEIKSMVSEDLFLRCQKVLNDLAASKRILHINYYFDTLDFSLYSLGNTLRIRQKDNELKIEYKYEKSYTGMVKTCKEYELALQSFLQSLTSEILPDAHDSIECYSYIGNLITERFNYIYRKAIVSLDTNYYLGKCDYELEIEFQDYSQAQEILRLLPITNFETSKMGKYSRFVMELQRLNNSK